MFHLPSAEKPLQIFEFMSNVLPFVSNWMNDVFSQLFVQYVKQKENEIYAMLFENCRCPLPAPSCYHKLLIDTSFDAFL